MITLALADDHTVLREGLKRLLQQTHDIVVKGEAASALQVLDLLGKCAFDLLVLDMSMPGRDGIDLIRQIRAEHPRIPILVLTMHAEQQYAARAIKAGAAGYLTKDIAADELVQAVRRVASGGNYISPQLAENMLFEQFGRRKDLPHLALSDREFLVFRYLASGLNNTDIARQLLISIKTVSTYKSRILAKMQLRTPADLVRYAFTHGLLDEEEATALRQSSAHRKSALRRSL